MRVSSFRAFFLSSVALALACSSQNGTPSEPGGTGGGVFSGGVVGSGAGGAASGGRSSGGQSSAGNSSGGDSGGTHAAGGATETTGGAANSSGGAANAGGASASGGTASSGSAPASGGGPTELGNATVWLAGDSTVANGNTPCPVGWGKPFDGLFDERVKVVNSAVGGRSVRTWLYDVKDTMDNSTGECVLGETNGSLTIQQRWLDMLEDMKEGDFLLIQFGINDGDSTCPRHVGVDALRQEYRMMAEAALDRGTQPVFITPVSAIKCSGSTAVASRGFLDAVRDEGAALNVPVIDLHARSIALYNELQFCPVTGGDVSSSTGGPVGAFFCDDHTHFDTPGALEIGKLVAEGLEEAGVTLAGYLL